MLVHTRLSSLGYVQFVTKKAYTTDFDTGSPFFYDTALKEFGRLDMISSENLESAIVLRKEFKAIIAKLK